MFRERLKGDAIRKKDSEELRRVAEKHGVEPSKPMTVGT